MSEERYRLAIVLLLAVVVAVYAYGAMKPSQIGRYVVLNADGYVTLDTVTGRWYAIDRALVSWITRSRFSIRSVEMNRRNVNHEWSASNEG